MVSRYHPLGERPLFGARLRYLVRCGDQWVGALGFSASSFQVASRDEYIGWSTAARKANLQEVVNNSRFLVRPMVRVENLGSYVLTLATRRLARDWQRRHGYRPLLVETYVDKHRPGTSYRAAGWKEVGRTSGRGRQDASRTNVGTSKRIFVHPLVAGWQRRLCREPPSKRHVSCDKLPKASRDDARWVERELGDAPFRDPRLTRRLVALVKDFWAKPEGSVLQACDSVRAKVKAAYRFMDNKNVTMDKILRPHYGSTVTRIGDWGTEQLSENRRSGKPVVLAIQDTTTITYRDRPAARGLGYINSPDDNARGFLVHDTLALTSNGLPLGLLDVQSWARDDEQFGSKNGRKNRAIEEKESNKWLMSYEAVAQAQRLLPNVTLVSTGDREGDVFELFALAASRQDHPELLVRAEHDRWVELAGRRQKLWEAVEGTPPRAESDTYVPRRSARGNRAEQKARETTLEIRYAEVALLPPQNNAAARREGSLPIWAVHAKEKAAPSDAEPLEWMLLTTLSITSPEDAIEKIQWYVRRFQIEVYHKIIKSGCNIEARQNRRVERLQNALALDMIVAWRIMYLMAMGRTVPNLPCTVILDDHEWKALHAFVHKTTETPIEAPSMNAAIRMAASLGGFLGRRCDGEPGVKALWKGMTRLEDIASSWLIFGPRLPTDALAKSSTTTT
jgi:hypothetical protein